MKARIQNPLATFPFIEPRRVVRSAIPGKGVWDAREEAWELMRPASQRAILTRLREAFAEGEQARASTPWSATATAWARTTWVASRSISPVTDP